MSNNRTPITVDAVDYSVEVGHGGDVIWVYDTNGDMVASGERDTAVEQFFAFSIDPEDGEETHLSAGRDIYDQQDPLEIARWMVGAQA